VAQVATIEIFTDGSVKKADPSSSNGSGGWAAILQSTVGGQLCEKELSGGAENVPIGLMELTAVTAALTAVKKEGHDIVIYLDPEWISKAINSKWPQGWQKKNWRKSSGDPVPVHLIPLWEKILPVLAVNNVRCVHIKSQSNGKKKRADRVSLMNQRADELAGKIASKLKDMTIEGGTC
jgi:ribonuclease HI